jgi:Cu-processing system ATP-binding protein
MSALIIKNISKQYGQVKSVDDVSLNIEAGQIIALLGHNGAGKTTLIKMILGLSKTSSGSIEIFGAKPGSKKARLSISYLPENVAFHGSLTGREQLHHFAKLKSESKKRADEILEKVGISHAMDRPIGTYSKGMRQRIGLAQALLGQPKLALLDEPTSGLDPISRHEFYNIVEELANTGTAVLISSHALTEMESKTDRIAILSQGKLVANDSLENLRKSANLPIRFNIKTKIKSAKKIAVELNGKQINGRSIEIFCKRGEKIKILQRISSFGDKIEDIDINPPSLEELYRHYSLSKTGDMQ